MNQKVQRLIIRSYFEGYFFRSNFCTQFCLPPRDRINCNRLQPDPTVYSYLLVGTLSRRIFTVIPFKRDVSYNCEQYRTKTLAVIQYFNINFFLMEFNIKAQTENGRVRYATVRAQSGYKFGAPFVTNFTRNILMNVLLKQLQQFCRFRLSYVTLDLRQLWDFQNKFSRLY